MKIMDATATHNLSLCIPDTEEIRFAANKSDKAGTH